MNVELLVKFSSSVIQGKIKLCECHTRFFSLSFLRGNSMRILLSVFQLPFKRSRVSVQFYVMVFWTINSFLLKIYLRKCFPKNIFKRVFFITFINFPMPFFIESMLLLFIDEDVAKHVIIHFCLFFL